MSTLGATPSPHLAAAGASLQQLRQDRDDQPCKIESQKLKDEQIQAFCREYAK
ncbi:hypothetical protein BGZ99_003943, partial [Dissophora globulifera]